MPDTLFGAYHIGICLNLYGTCLLHNRQRVLVHYASYFDFGASCLQLKLYVLQRISYNSNAFCQKVKIRHRAELLLAKEHWWGPKLDGAADMAKEEET